MTDLMVLPPHVLLNAKRLSRKRGHAAPPGTGPAGETCGSCANLFRNEQWSKTFLKCGLMRGRWTGSYGTDVRARDEACSKWKALAP